MENNLHNGDTRGEVDVKKFVSACLWTIGSLIFIGILFAADSVGEGGAELVMFAVFLFLLGILCLLIYLLPAIIAFKVKHPHKWPILIVNVFFGATLLGWVGCLVWCFLFREKSY